MCSFQICRVPPWHPWALLSPMVTLCNAFSPKSDHIKESNKLTGCPKRRAWFSALWICQRHILYSSIVFWLNASQVIYLCIWKMNSFQRFYVVNILKLSRYTWVQQLYLSQLSTKFNTIIVFIVSLNCSKLSILLRLVLFVWNIEICLHFQIF